MGRIRSPWSAGPACSGLRRPPYRHVALQETQLGPAYLGNLSAVVCTFRRFSQVQGKKNHRARSKDFFIWKKYKKILRIGLRKFTKGRFVPGRSVPKEICPQRVLSPKLYVSGRFVSGRFISENFVWIPDIPCYFFLVFLHVQYGLRKYLLPFFLLFTLVLSTVYLQYVHVHTCFVTTAILCNHGRAFFFRWLLDLDG